MLDFLFNFAGEFNGKMGEGGRREECSQSIGKNQMS